MTPVDLLRRDARAYRGLQRRSFLLVPLLLLSAFLPPVVPIDRPWVWAAIAVYQFVNLAVVVQILRMRRGKAGPAPTVAGLVAAQVATGLLIVGVGDLGSSLPTMHVAALLFVGTLMTRRWVRVLGWVVTVVSYAASIHALEPVAEHTFTRSAFFAGVSGIVLLAASYVNDQRALSYAAAEAMSELARVAVEAGDLQGVVARAQTQLRALTGATRVDVVEPSQLARLAAIPDVLVVPLGSADSPSVALHAVSHKSSQTAQVVEVLATVYRRERRMSEMWIDSRTDPLTGLPNRRVLVDTLAAEPAPTGTAIVMIDLDHFKRYNDAHGHAAGDVVLCRFADLLRAEVREPDVVVRYGGEEICLVIQGSLRSAAAIVERIRRSWAKLEPEVTFSAGIAARDDGSDRDAAIVDADTALYAAKAAGRATTVVQQPHLAAAR